MILLSGELFIRIVEAVLTIVVSLITAFVIPWIKSKFTESQLEQLQKYAEIGVRTAEQIYSTEEYSSKKEYVVNYLTTIVKEKLNIRVTEEDIESLVESTVNLVKYGSDYKR